MDSGHLFVSGVFTGSTAASVSSPSMRGMGARHWDAINWKLQSLRPRNLKVCNPGCREPGLAFRYLPEDHQREVPSPGPILVGRCGWVHVWLTAELDQSPARGAGCQDRQGPVPRWCEGRVFSHTVLESLWFGSAYWPSGRPPENNQFVLRRGRTWFRPPLVPRHPSVIVSCLFRYQGVWFVGRCTQNFWLVWLWLKHFDPASDEFHQLQHGWTSNRSHCGCESGQVTF